MAEEVTASCSSRCISEDELLSKLSNPDVVVLDCRDHGPNIKGANRVRLPKVLLRRLSAGTLPPVSVCAALLPGHAVLVISDAVTEGSLAEQVAKLLVDKGFDVQLSLVDANQLLAEKCELKEETCASDGFNEIGTLSLENLQLHENKNNFEKMAATRRSFDMFPVEILPYLYLGNADTARNRNLLDRYNIRYIINVTRDLDNKFESDNRFHYLKIAVDDTCTNNLAKHFPRAIKFIEEAANAGGAVLVHCVAGISRSVTVCLAYLMHARRSTLDEAFDLVHQRNALIDPNFHFMGQLSEFERQLDRLNLRDATLNTPTSSTTSESD